MVRGPHDEDGSLTDDDVALAERLYAEWNDGMGVSKSQIEIREWGDATAHGRRFDRFVRRALGVSTTRPSRQTDRIGALENQLRRIGEMPEGTQHEVWEVQLQHARVACLQALRIWNDPTANYRTGTFSLLFVAAWNSLAIALLQLRGEEWRELDEAGIPRERDGTEQAMVTMELIGRAFPAPGHVGLRENVRDWVNLRNCAAHRHLPALDTSVIPLAQAGLVNFESTLASGFGEGWLLGEHLSVPLQLSGFRDPGVLASAKRLQASLPLDVQAILSRVGEATPELLADETYVLRVAFIPIIPASGRSPDAVAYFMRPEEVPEELSDALDRFVVLPKVGRLPRPNLGAKEVVRKVSDRIPWVFNVSHHANVARKLGVRPASDASDKTSTEMQFCEYVPAAKLYLYNQAWVDRLEAILTTAEDFQTNTGRPPQPKA